MCTKGYTVIGNDADRILIIFIKMGAEIEKMGKLFLMIGNKGCTIRDLHTEINTGMGIAIYTGNGR